MARISLNSPLGVYVDKYWKIRLYASGNCYAFHFPSGRTCYVSYVNKEASMRGEPYLGDLHKAMVNRFNLEL